LQEFSWLGLRKGRRKLFVLKGLSFNQTPNQIIKIISQGSPPPETAPKNILKNGMCYAQIAHVLASSLISHRFTWYAETNSSEKLKAASSLI
jgi:hypothetical protein